MCKIIYQHNLVKGQFTQSKEKYAKINVIFHYKGAMERKLSCTNYNIIVEKKSFNTVSHFSYASPFQGPHFYDENAGIKHSL